MSLRISINRDDPEVVIIDCFIDNIKIGDSYFFNPSMTDEEIELDIRQDLINKGYVI